MGTIRPAHVLASYAFEFPNKCHKEQEALIPGNLHQLDLRPARQGLYETRQGGGPKEEVKPEVASVTPAESLPKSLGLSTALSVPADKMPSPVKPSQSGELRTARSIFTEPPKPKDVSTEKPGEAAVETLSHHTALFEKTKPEKMPASGENKMVEGESGDLRTARSRSSEPGKSAAGTLSLHTALSEKPKPKKVPVSGEPKMVEGESGDLRTARSRSSEPPAKKPKEDKWKKPKADKTEKLRTASPESLGVKGEREGSDDDLPRRRARLTITWSDGLNVALLLASTAAPSTRLDIYRLDGTAVLKESKDLLYMVPSPAGGVTKVALVQLEKEAFDLFLEVTEDAPVEVRLRIYFSVMSKLKSESPGDAVRNAAGYFLISFGKDNYTVSCVSCK